MGIFNLWPFSKNSHSQFEQLLRPHLQQLYRLAYRYTGHRDDAEDLVQDLLLKLYPRLQEMQAIDKLGPWLSRVLYRLFVDQYRRHQRSPIDFTDDEQSVYESHESDEVDPVEVTHTQITNTVLNAALGRLKEEQRLLVLLHDVEGYSLQEINQMIDVPIGTLKSRLSRTRQKLQDIINKMEPHSL